jgi:hypothetical protein
LRSLNGWPIFDLAVANHLLYSIFSNSVTTLNQDLDWLSDNS